MFIPKLGEYFQFDDHIFQMGWNHQLVDIHDPGFVAPLTMTITTDPKYLLNHLVCLGLVLNCFLFWPHTMCCIHCDLWFWYATKILRAFLTSFSAGYKYVYMYISLCVFSLKVVLQATPIFVVHFFIQKRWKCVRPREKNLRHTRTHAQKHNFFNGLYLPNYEQRDLT